MLGFFVRRAIKKSPVLSSLHERSENLISEICQNGIGEDVARDWARQTFSHLLPALNSRDARIECRKLLVEWALLSSDYKVMMIPPAPEPDWTGLRGLPGISGELPKYKMRLAEVYEPIRALLHAGSVGINQTTVQDAILVLGTQAGYLVNMANSARIRLDDYHHDLDKDWFHPMIYSFAVSSENDMRRRIGLPVSLDEEIAALAHKTMVEVVLSGSQFPDVTWREHYRDQLRRGLVSLPAFEAGYIRGS